MVTICACFITESYCFFRIKVKQQRKKYYHCFAYYNFFPVMFFFLIIQTTTSWIQLRAFTLIIEIFATLTNKNYSCKMSNMDNEYEYGKIMSVNSRNHWIWIRKKRWVFFKQIKKVKNSMLKINTWWPSMVRRRLRFFEHMYLTAIVCKWSWYMQNVCCNSSPSCS